MNRHLMRVKELLNNNNFISTKTHPLRRVREFLKLDENLLPKFMYLMTKLIIFLFNFSKNLIIPI